MRLADRHAVSASPEHAYRGYGLNIVSALPLPELFAGDDAAGAPDITITIGALSDVAPQTSAATRRIGPFLWATADQFCFHVPGIARFRISAGHDITIDPDPGSGADDIRVFLLGTALGVLLTQRGNLMLHGNAVRIGDGCVVCVGISGAGKSTLAAGFRRRGFAPLADDLVMVDERCRVMPGIPRIKLWADTAKAMAIDTAPLHRIRPNLEKFSYPVEDGFAHDPAPVRAVYSLLTGNADTVSIEHLTGFAKFKEVRANTYRPRFVEAMALRGRYMALCTRLAAAAPVALLARPVMGFTVDRVIDAILADLGEPG